MSAPTFDPSETFPEATREAWAALAREALAKAGPLRTPDGVSVAALYSSGDWPGDTGARPAGGAAGPIVRSRIDCADPAEANRRIKEEIAGGAGAVAVVLDDAVRALDFGLPAGKGGLALRSLEDLAALLDGIDPAVARIDFSAGAGAAAVARMLGELQASKRRELSTLKSSLGFDPFSSLARFGGLAGEPGGALSEAAELAVHVRKNAPGVRVFEVYSLIYHHAGATPAEEAAAALAGGVASLRALAEAGLSLAGASAAIGFCLTADADFLASIAKLRAFRRLWARVLEASGDAAAADSLVVNAVTSPRMMAVKDPHTNLLRTTCAAAAAIIGGADAITVLPFTERIGGSALARRLARNTAIILTEEADLARVIDPAAGSFALEALSEALAQESWALFQEIEREGGLGASLIAGKLQARIAESGRARRARIAGGEIELVGVTKYPPPGRAALALDPPPQIAPARPARHKALEQLAARTRIAAPALAPAFDDAEGVR